MTEREFWMLVRMALIQVVKAIEKRWMCKDQPKDTPVDLENGCG